MTPTAYLDRHNFNNPTHHRPLDFSREVDPTAVGMRTEFVQKLVGAFEHQYKRKFHSAAQLVVLRHGQVVVDRTIGTLSFENNTPVTPHTPFLLFSASKAITAMAVHKLIEEGKVAWDAPVAYYWPVWGQRDKQQATIRHVFTHQSGIAQPHLMQQIPLWPFWKLVTLDIALTRAEFEPGTACGYQTVNFGFILGEVIRRVTGMDAGTYIENTIFKPLGLEDSTVRISRAALKTSPRLAAGGKTFKNAVWLFNQPIIRRALIPAATMHASARDLAVFYQMLLNGGEYAGQRLFQPETIGGAIAPGYKGPDRTMQTESFWAHGFHLGGESKATATAFIGGEGKGSSESTFAHYGMGTCMAWADWREQVVVAFTCNKLLEPPGPDARWNQLNNWVWDALS
ncbi:MAG: beta-lactamase family protein [Anaerolineae bacterium]|nr:beta-lactamase family protein [Anaerolineae bacterium]